VKREPRLVAKGRVTVPLVAGFTISALAVFGLASLIGQQLGGGPAVPLRAAAVAVLVVCVAADLAFPRIRCSVVRRQTPKDLVHRLPRELVGFVWGLDTGTVVSTYRASAASFAALAVVFAGWAPPWAGALYAGGFCIPLLAIVATEGAGRAVWQHEVDVETVARAVATAGAKLRLASAGLIAAAAALAVAQMT
jgi:hypothetical protein